MNKKVLDKHNICNVIHELNKYIRRFLYSNEAKLTILQFNQ